MIVFQMGVIDRKEREKVEMKRQILDAARSLFWNKGLKKQVFVILPKRLSIVQERFICILKIKTRFFLHYMLRLLEH